jgi:hypothetical protein
VHRYPITYTFITLPFCVVRTLVLANRYIGPAGRLLTKAIWNLFGVVDVTLFLWTRPNILSFHDDAYHDGQLPSPSSPQPSEPKSLREEQEPEDRNTGHYTPSENTENAGRLPDPGEGDWPGNGDIEQVPR